MLIRIRENAVFGSRNINRQIVFLQQPDTSFGWEQCSLIPPSKTCLSRRVKKTMSLLVGNRFYF